MQHSHDHCLFYDHCSDSTPSKSVILEMERKLPAKKISSVENSWLWPWDVQSSLFLYLLCFNFDYFLGIVSKSLERLCLFVDKRIDWRCIWSKHIGRLCGFLFSHSFTVTCMYVTFSLYARTFHRQTFYRATIRLLLLNIFWKCTQLLLFTFYWQRTILESLFEKISNNLSLKNR